MDTNTNNQESVEPKENPLRAEKKRKLQELKDQGIDVYPHNFERTGQAEQIKSKFSHIEDGEKLNEEVYTIAGRLMTKRDMGKASFFNIQDQSGNIQVYLKTAALSEKDQLAFKGVDIGDIIGVKGFIFKTKKGELSVHASEFNILCKTLEPLPEKFHGLTDVEAKYRHRHLDLIMNPDSRKVFEMRSKIIREMRNYMDNKGFLEVETPVLQPIYGGAAAHPFSTHHRALDMKLFMKISPELYLKRLIVGGFEKVYEIGKNFRNEGIDRSHNPEFTMMEYYEAYTDYNYQMEQFEDLVATVTKKVCGTTKIKYQGKDLDITTPWRRLTVHDGIREYAKFDPDELSDDQLYAKIQELGYGGDRPASRGEMLMEAFDLKVEEHLWNPTFVIDHPVEISPLTKSHRIKEGLVERFEPVMAGMELGNAYTELNDPEEQLARLEEQESKRLVDEEAQPMDRDFLHAIDVGMPPTGGVGIGVERLVMVLTDSHSIRDIIFFPTMKPKS
ncbi:MAG: lysine--tRNA ligase [Bdellovibrionaceae bacterium]|jgi:lysyl-tRNA synthetase, class II|nr:lysine--tRNA ligase [Pseudobdellovibrionaceae bacterium]